MRQSNVRAFVFAGIAIAALLGAGVGYVFAPRNGSMSFNGGGEMLAQADGYRSLNITRNAYAVFVPRLSAGAYEIHAEWTPDADALIVAPTYADIRAAITDGTPPHLYYAIEGARALDTVATPYRPLNGIMSPEHAAPILARMYARELENASEGRLPDDAIIQQYDQFLLSAYSFVIIFRTDEAPPPFPTRSMFEASTVVETGGPSLLATRMLLVGAGLAAMASAGLWFYARRIVPGDPTSTGSVLERALRSSAQFEAFARRSKITTRALTAAVSVIASAGFFAITTFQHPGSPWPERDAAFSAFLSFYTFFAAVTVVLGTLALQRAKAFERDMRDWRIRFEEVRQDQQRFIEDE